MNRGIDKHAVQRRFHQAAPAYDALARIQREALQILALQLDHKPARGPTLDAGCGTGGALGTLAAHSPTVIALDLAPGMVRRAAQPRAAPICGDIEALPLPDRSIGLYWSNLAWQWCDTALAVAEAHRVLMPGGQLLVSTLGTGTLSELRAAFAGLDDARHVIDFETRDSLLQALASLGFTQIEHETRTLTAWQPDTATVLRELKQLGAAEVGSQRRRGLIGRKLWQTIQSRYEQHRTAHGLPVSYEVIFLKAEKT